MKKDIVLSTAAAAIMQLSTRWSQNNAELLGRNKTNKIRGFEPGKLQKPITRIPKEGVETWMRFISIDLDYSSLYGRKDWSQILRGRLGALVIIKRRRGSWFARY
jgi:hypothetical protein